MHRFLVRMPILMLFALAAPIWGAVAETRIALVMGNADYQAIGELANPANDANLIAERLENVGFAVTKVVNADEASMKRSIAAFGRKLRNAGQEATGLFYFAGHGVQSFGTNYLLPVDTLLNDPADLPLVGVEAESVLQQMYSARNRTNIVILDACRNNPFENIREFTDNGLAEMRAPTGTFLSYATAPGAVAYDGIGSNSPFSAALAEHLTEVGAPVEQVFKQVRVSVLEKTDGLQTPWDTSSLTSDFVFAEAPAAGGEGKPTERELVDRARKEKSQEAYEAYLQHFPNGLFAEFARSELLALSTPAPQVAAPAAEAGVVTFSAPLGGGDPNIAGRSLEQLLAGAPAFPPIEGLPAELWQGQQCASCHQWSRADLCVQANVYLDARQERAARIEHPLGPAFKTAMLNWAQNGCL